MALCRLPPPSEASATPDGRRTVVRNMAVARHKHNGENHLQEDKE
jgi:hypothetical protein